MALPVMEINRHRQHKGNKYYSIDDGGIDLL
uniref:Uncharacterized protein n=1 Tax=Candidatus Methanophaga sp. ANME-1 ERB7 TaxID=2759913 RepID=A0A7G9Z4F8_9EURY|nr:hypothetical protein FBIBDDDO_00004 [Methanosarcinales archaeon ANME-1 ERB7]